MPKYLLLKRYRGGPQPHRPVPPIDQWAPEDVEAHMAFGPGGQPLYEWIDVREVMWERPWTTDAA
jgi:hypothetical protein